MSIERRANRDNRAAKKNNRQEERSHEPSTDKTYDQPQNKTAPALPFSHHTTISLPAHPPQAPECFHHDPCVTLFAVMPEAAYQSGRP